MNTVETFSRAPVHAQTVDNGLGRDFFGGTLIGDTMPETGSGRISMTFKFARHPRRLDLAVPISPRSMSLDGTFGITAIKKEGFFARAAFRSASLNLNAMDTGTEKQAKERKLVPIYFDEFASFVCVEFADFISKARSAKFALHSSHQSIGDIMEVSKGFLNRITDNIATKIVLRINDPDSAEFFARSFGTKEIQKTTQRITNTKEIEDAEIVGE